MQAKCSLQCIFIELTNSTLGFFLLIVMQQTPLNVEIEMFLKGV